MDQESYPIDSKNIPSFAMLRIHIHWCENYLRCGVKKTKKKQAALAQSVARRSHNPKVVSSILTGGRLFFVSHANQPESG